MDGLKATATAFLAWWLRELAACIPPALRQRLFRARGRLVFDVEGAVISVRDADNGNERFLGRVADADEHPTAAAAELRGLLAGIDARRRDMRLRLSPAAALRRRIEMPAAAEENLQQVVAFDMERQTPFPADQVYFQARVVERFPDRHRIGVDLIVVPRSLADPAIELLRRLGIAVGGIEMTAGGERQPRVFSLAADSGREPANRRRRLATATLAGAAGVLAVAAVIVPLQRQEQRAAALAAEVAAAKTQADVARRTQEEIDTLAAIDRFLSERRATRPPKVAVIDELTRVLPDDTWLYRFRITGEEVQTFGYSAAASNLIAPIDTSDMFRTPQFLAPLMRDQRIDAERFHISFQIEKAAGS
jgi:general secretion pathway protein L